MNFYDNVLSFYLHLYEIKISFLKNKLYKNNKNNLISDAYKSLNYMTTFVILEKLEILAKNSFLLKSFLCFFKLVSSVQKLHFYDKNHKI